MVIRLVNCVCEEQIKLAWLILVISAMVIVFFGHIFVQKLLNAVAWKLFPLIKIMVIC